MSRCVATPFPHSYSPSPFRQPTQRTEEAASSRRPEQEGQVPREEKPYPGPSAGYESQLEDLLAESFGRVRSPMAGINEDDEPVEDDGLRYVQERSVLLMTLEQVLTDSARPFRFQFRRGAAPDPSSVNDSQSGNKRNPASVPPSGENFARASPSYFRTNPPPTLRRGTNPRSPREPLRRPASHASRIALL